MKKLYLALSVFFSMMVAVAQAQVYGCTDPLATNFNSSATVNNGSCTYNAAAIAPSSSFNLAGNVIETSGLIRWDNRVWTHNDNTDINIYALDTANGSISGTYPLSGTSNTDWEEISQDAAYVYMGDFGNNANGNRTDLKIYRIAKSSILSGTPAAETINFSYSNQSSFTPAGPNHTDFDCEAMTVTSDSIYLFTKQWISNKTSVYSLPKTPGTYVAKLKTTYDVQGLITGAVMLQPENLVALCGYSNSLQPFVYLLYDYNGSDFFGGNKRKITISLPYHQVEGIATTNGLKFYISNEYFSYPPFITIPQKLHILDLSSFLSTYLSRSYSMLQWNGSLSTDWNTAGNWYPAVRPKATNNITIPEANNQPVINETTASPAVCNNLTIASGAGLTLAEGKALSVSGTLSNTAGLAGLTIKAGASLLTGTTGVQARLESYIPANEWHLISSPVADALSGIFTGNFLQSHSEITDKYTDITSNSLALDPMKGYSLWGGESGFTSTYAGILNAGNIGLSDNLSRSGADNPLTPGDDYGWNLVGNPYPSSIDWLAASGWTKINVDDAIYIHVNNTSWATFAGGLGTNQGSRYIAPGQGFFVHVSGPTFPLSGTLQMNDAVRVHHATTFFKNSESNAVNFVRLEISGNGYKDETIVHFLPEATEGFDREYDALKLFGDSGTALQIYSVASNPLSINSLPQAGTVPLGVHAGMDGTYSIAANEINDLSCVILEDTKTGIFTDLSALPYTFSLAAGENEQRFRLHFTPLSTAEDPVVPANVYSYQKNIVVQVDEQAKADVYICTVSGLLLACKTAASGTIRLRVGSAGTYIVKVVSGKSILVKKIVVL